MTQDQYYNMRIGDIIYNILTKKVVILESCWIENKERKEDDYICAPTIFDKCQYENVMAKDCANWYYVTNESPIEIQFMIMKMRFDELYQFVHAKLR